MPLAPGPGSADPPRGFDNLFYRHDTSRMRFSRFCPTFALLFASFSFSLAAVQAQSESVNLTEATNQAKTIASWRGTIFRIEDAQSRVSIASVKLSVSDLKPENGYLVGEYTIKVPLMKSKGDRGKIILPLDISMDNLGHTGGTLRGEAISYKKNKSPNTIVCRIFPGTEQFIELDITTKDRTLQFESRYTIVEQPKDS